MAAAEGFEAEHRLHAVEEAKTRSSGHLARLC